MPRRSLNIGTVGWHTGKSCYYGTFPLPGDGTGKRKRHWEYGASEAEVRRKLETAYVKVRQGQSPTPERTRLATFLDQWLKEVVKPHKSVNTYEARRAEVARITTRIGALPLGKLTGQHIQRLVNDLSREYKPNTVRATHGCLVTALNKAVDWGKLTRNPALRVELPAQPKDRPRVLTVEESRRFVDACGTERYGELLVTTLALGLRLGEVRGLRWPNVDLERGTLTITHQAQREAGKGIVLKAPKDKEERTITLPAFLVALLRQQQTAVKLDRLAAGERWQDRGLVFPNRYGTPVEAGVVQRALERVLTACELPRLTPHKLRHSCASILVAQKVPLTAIAEILGHRDLSMLSRVYAHVLAESRDEAAVTLDRLLGG